MATKKEEVKKIDKVEIVNEEKAIEAVLNTDNAVGIHTVFLENGTVIFDNGKAIVSESFYNVLKDAGIVK